MSYYTRRIDDSFTVHPPNKKVTFLWEKDKLHRRQSDNTAVIQRICAEYQGTLLLGDSGIVVDKQTGNITQGMSNLLRGARLTGAQKNQLRRELQEIWKEALSVNEHQKNIVKHSSFATEIFQEMEVTNRNIDVLENLVKEVKENLKLFFQGDESKKEAIEKHLNILEELELQISVFGKSYFDLKEGTDHAEFRPVNMMDNDINDFETKVKEKMGCTQSAELEVFFLKGQRYLDVLGKIERINNPDDDWDESEMLLLDGLLEEVTALEKECEKFLPKKPDFSYTGALFDIFQRAASYLESYFPPPPPPLEKRSPVATTQTTNAEGSNSPVPGKQEAEDLVNHVHTTWKSRFKVAPVFREKTVSALGYELGYDSISTFIQEVGGLEKAKAVFNSTWSMTSNAARLYFYKDMAKKIT